jgi:hypothetical protein
MRRNASAEIVRRRMRGLCQAAIALLVAATIIAGTAEAAVISWNVVGLTDATQVSTSGTFKEGLFFRNTSTTTPTTTEINGVTFTRLGVTGNVNPSTASSGGHFSTNSTGISNTTMYSGGLPLYSDLLATQIFGSDVLRNTVTLSSLTNGQAYHVQLFFADNRTGAVETRQPVIDYGTVNEFDSAPTYGANPPKPNGFVINGTFTADAASQTFTINNVDTSTTPRTLQGFQLNAYQLRAVPVPEPATIGMLGAGAGLLLFLRRFRR